MIYHIGDKFLLGGEEVEVRFINNKKAWVVPTEGNTWAVIDVLNEKGISKSGTKAVVLNNSKCGAI